MLRSILELAEVDVAEVMHHRQDLLEIDADLPPSRIVELVLESPYTRIPLWRGTKDNIIGMLHAKALLRQGREAGFDQLLEMSAAIQALAHQTDDHHEGVSAALEKRTPRFNR